MNYIALMLCVGCFFPSLKSDGRRGRCRITAFAQMKPPDLRSLAQEELGGEHGTTRQSESPQVKIFGEAGRRRVVEACGVEDDRYGGCWSFWFGS